MELELLHSKKAPRVAIITVCWNSSEQVNKFLKHLDGIALTEKTEIIVIDNASKIPFRAENEPGRLKIIRLEENLGFAGGCNEGINYAIANNFDYLWLLNNDLEIEPNCLEELIIHAENDPETGALSPTIFNLEDKSKLQFAGATPDLDNLEITYHKRNCELKSSNKLLLWGTAMLVRSECIKKEGYLNQKYFAYWEDFEFSWRLINGGYKTAVVTSARCFHLWDANSGVSRRQSYFYYYMARNSYYFWRELSESVIGKWTFNRIYLAQILEQVSGRLDIGDIKAATAIIQGYADAKRGIVGIYTPRQMRVQIALFFLAPYFFSRILRGDYAYILHRLQK